MSLKKVRKEDIPELSTESEKGLILGILIDFLEDADKFFSFADHVGFDLSAISHISQLPAAWVAQYRLKNGGYDADRACLDLATWPPVAMEIVKKLDAEAHKKRESAN